MGMDPGTDRGMALATGPGTARAMTARGMVVRDMAIPAGGADPGWVIFLTDAATALPLRAATPALFAALALAVDQATKALILLVAMQPPRVIPVTPFFNLTLGFNEGASFGLLGGVMQGRPWAMVALTAGITLLFAVMALRSRSALERAGLGLIVGGSTGNIVDRLRQGAVTDFLDFHWQGWHWPTFNMADVAIFIGAVLLLGALLPWPRQRQPGTE